MQSVEGYLRSGVNRKALKENQRRTAVIRPRNHVLPSPEPQFYSLTRGFNREVELNMKVAQPLLNVRGTPISDDFIS